MHFRTFTKIFSPISYLLKAIYSVKTVSSGLSLKDVDGKQGIVTGYFANFNNQDSDGDIILPGAFAKSIGDTGPNSPNPRIKHLMNHRVDQPLGVIKVLIEDSKGLYYESQVGSHTLGQDFIKMAESGLITEHSIGFRTVDSNFDKETGVNYLKSLQLWEGSSLTGWGANEMTPLTGMKSMYSAEQMAERQRNIEKFCKSTTASDETIEMLLLHCKQLSQAIIELQATQQPNNTGQEKDVEEAINLLKSLNTPIL